MCRLRRSQGRGAIESIDRRRSECEIFLFLWETSQVTYYCRSDSQDAEGLLYFIPSLKFPCCILIRCHESGYVAINRRGIRIKVPSCDPAWHTTYILSPTTGEVFMRCSSRIRQWWPYKLFLWSRFQEDTANKREGISWNLSQRDSDVKQIQANKEMVNLGSLNIRINNLSCGIFWFFSLFSWECYLFHAEWTLN